MKNTAGALDYLHELEAEAEKAHRRVADHLEGIRVLLDRATVKRYGRLYQLTTIRAHRGFVRCYGVRIYNGKAGVRGYDLGDLRECEIVEYFDRERDTPKHVPKPNPDPRCHPNHR